MGVMVVLRSFPDDLQLEKAFRIMRNGGGRAHFVGLYSFLQVIVFDIYHPDLTVLLIPAMGILNVVRYFESKQIQL